MVKVMVDREVVCKHCRRFVIGDTCPACNTKDFTKTWKGVVVINDPEGSEIAKLLEINAPGKYALWVK
jgi:DNA-directed RNA polymerase subunit E"